MNQPNQLVRLALASAVVMIALLVLWQAGLLFKSDKATVSNSSGQSVQVRAADTSVDTPNQSGLKVGLEAGDLAPDFEFSTFDGQRQRLSDYRGRPVFLNFWASWCGPCRYEMPDMMTMLDQYGPDAGNLAVIAVNDGESVEGASAFLNNLDIKLTAIGYDPTEAIIKRYNVTLGLPESYFIDANGVITRVISGQVQTNVMESSVQEAIAGWDAIKQSDAKIP